MCKNKSKVTKKQIQDVLRVHMLFNVDDIIKSLQDKYQNIVIPEFNEFHELLKDTNHSLYKEFIKFPKDSLTQRQMDFMDGLKNYLDKKGGLCLISNLDKSKYEYCTKPNTTFLSKVYKSTESFFKRRKPMQLFYQYQQEHLHHMHHHGQEKHLKTYGTETILANKVLH